jgi:HSP20 family protein
MLYMQFPDALVSPRLRSLTRDLDAWFGAMAEGPKGPAPLQFVDDGSAFVIEGDVPGVKSDAVKLEVTARGYSLSIDAPAPKFEGARVLHRERTAMSVSHRAQFPADVDVDKVTARLENGALRIVFPRAAVVAPRLIPVEG